MKLGKSYFIFLLISISVMALFYLLIPNSVQAQSNRPTFLDPLQFIPKPEPPTRIRLNPLPPSLEPPSQAPSTQPKQLINIECDPTLTPSNGGCGISAFVGLIKGIIDYLLTIIVPSVAILMFVWAGFVIMTAGGSTTRFEKGKKIIIAALVGVVIALGVWLIIHGIYQLLGVSDKEVPIPK